MKVVIDTSSLLSLIRYYLPFDKRNILYDYVGSQIQNGDLIIIDAVLEECKYTAQKLVLKTLSYLDNKNFKKLYKIPTRTKNLLLPAPKRFYNMLDNQFRTQHSRRLNEAEFEQYKKEFLDSADARMIIYALNEKHIDKNAEIIIVTEESETANDNKAFKKIPAICKPLGLTV